MRLARRSLASVMAARTLRGRKERPSAAAEVDYAAEVERALESALGRGVRLREKNGAGRIELAYYDADDREALIRQLESLGRNQAGKE